MGNLLTRGTPWGSCPRLASSPRERAAYSAVRRSEHEVPLQKESHVSFMCTVFLSPITHQDRQPKPGWPLGQPGWLDVPHVSLCLVSPWGSCQNPTQEGLAKRWQEPQGETPGDSVSASVYPVLASFLDVSHELVCSRKLVTRGLRVGGRLTGHWGGR